METKRQEKIAKLLQRDLGEIIQLHTRNHLPGNLITVTKVKVSPDLGVAKVFLSLFGPMGAPKLFEAVVQDKNEIRFLLGNRVKHQLRVVPVLEFFIDDSLDYIENIENLLKD